MKNLKQFIFFILFLSPLFLFGMQSQKNSFNMQMKYFWEYAKEQGINSAVELEKNIDKYKNEYPELLEIISDKIGREGREKINYVYQKRLWNWGYYPRKEEIEELTSRIQSIVNEIVNVNDNFDYDNFYRELKRFLFHCNPNYPNEKNAAGLLIDKIEKYDKNERENLMRYISNQLTLEDKQNIRDRFMPKPSKRSVSGDIDSLVQKLSLLISNFEETKSQAYLAEQQQKDAQARLEAERKTKELEAQRRQEFIEKRRRAVSVAPAVSNLDIFKAGLKSLLEHEISQNNTSARMLEQQMERHVGDEYISLLKFVYDNLSPEDKQKINAIYMHKTSGFGLLPREEEVKPLIGRLRLYVSKFELSLGSDKDVKVKVEHKPEQKQEKTISKEVYKKKQDLEKARAKYQEAEQKYEQYRAQLGLESKIYQNTSSSSSSSGDETDISGSGESPRSLNDAKLPDNFSELDEQGKIRSISNCNFGLNKAKCVEKRVEAGASVKLSKDQAKNLNELKKHADKLLKEVQEKEKELEKAEKGKDKK